MKPRHKFKPGDSFQPTCYASAQPTNTKSLLRLSQSSLKNLFTRPNNHGSSCFPAMLQVRLLCAQSDFDSDDPTSPLFCFLAPRAVLPDCLLGPALCLPGPPEAPFLVGKTTLSLTLSCSSKLEMILSIHVFCQIISSQIKLSNCCSFSG